MNSTDEFNKKICMNKRILYSEAQMYNEHLGKIKIKLFKNIESTTHSIFSYVYFIKMAIDNLCVQVILALDISRSILRFFRKHKKKG